MKAKKVLAAGVLCALAIGLTACGGGSAVPGSPQDKKAKAGGTKTVMLYSSMQEDQLNAIKQAFEKKYPDITSNEAIIQDIKSYFKILGKHDYLHNLKRDNLWLHT